MQRNTNPTWLGTWTVVSRQSRERVVWLRPNVVLGRARPIRCRLYVRDVAYRGDQQVYSRAESRAPPAVSDRVDILGVGITPLDLKRAVATLERWRAERRQEYVCVVSVH